MSGRGKIARVRRIGIVRELVRDDLEALREKRVPTIERLRDSHHRLARMFAAGLRPKAIAERTGYSLSRVIMLSQTPAFRDLIAQYREKVDSAFIDSIDEYYALATANMLKAERMLADKLDDADGDEVELPVKDLLAISRDAADRFGYGKKTTNVNVNVDFAAKLDAALKRSGKTIDSLPAGAGGEGGERDRASRASAPHHTIRRRA